MNFSLSEEQQMIVATTRDFVQQELYPHEQEIERTGVLHEELLRTLKAGSDRRGMKTSAVQQGGDFVINGTKHFISHVDHADFVILFAASGEEQTPRGNRKLITAFLIDMGTPDCRWPRPASGASGATRASSVSGTAPARCSGISSRGHCCGRWAADHAAPPRRAGALLPLPHRFALFTEGARSFLEVLGAQDRLHRVQAIVQFEGLVLADHLAVA